MKNNSSSSMENAVTLTGKDDSKSFNAGVGDFIKVELEMQGATGFNWHPEGLDETRLKLVKTETKIKSGNNTIGGPVLGVWYFQAVSAGDTELKMLYYRAWEGKQKAKKSLTLNLRIYNR
jgi:predicted secreted protein